MSCSARTPRRRTRPRSTSSPHTWPWTRQGGTRWRSPRPWPAGPPRSAPRPLPVVACQAWQLLGALVRHRDPAEATRCLEQARSIAAEHGLPIWEVHALIRLGNDDALLHGTLDRLEQARERALRAGAVTARQQAEASIALHLIMRGEYPAAQNLIDQVLTATTRLKLMETTQYVLLLSAVLAAHQGRRVEMQDALAEFRRWGGDESLHTQRVHGLAGTFCALLEENRPRALDELSLAVRAEETNPTCSTSVDGSASSCCWRRWPVRSAFRRTKRSSAHRRASSGGTDSSRSSPGRSCLAARVSTTPRPPPWPRPWRSASCTRWGGTSPCGWSPSRRSPMAGDPCQVAACRPKLLPPGEGHAGRRGVSHAAAPSWRAGHPTSARCRRDPHRAAGGGLTVREWEVLQLLTGRLATVKSPSDYTCHRARWSGMSPASSPRPAGQTGSH